MRYFQKQIMCNNEPLETLKSFKKPSLEDLSNHRRNESATRHLEARKRAYYASRNRCNCEELNCWVLKKCICDTLVTLKYGALASLSPPRKSFKMSKRVFLQSFTYQ